MIVYDVSAPCLALRWIKCALFLCRVSGLFRSVRAACFKLRPRITALEIQMIFPFPGLTLPPLVNEVYVCITLGLFRFISFRLRAVFYPPLGSTACGLGKKANRLSQASRSEKASSPAIGSAALSVVKHLGKAARNHEKSVSVE